MNNTNPVTIFASRKKLTWPVLYSALLLALIILTQDNHRNHIMSWILIVGATLLLMIMVARLLRLHETCIQMHSRGFTVATPFARSEYTWRDASDFKLGKSLGSKTVTFEYTGQLSKTSFFDTYNPNTGEGFFRIYNNYERSPEELLELFLEHKRAAVGGN